MMRKPSYAFFGRFSSREGNPARPVFRLALRALLVLLVLGGLAGCGAATASPTPTSLPPTPTNTPVPSPTFTATPVPTATPKPLTEKEKLLAEIQNCDPDPANWEFRDVGQWKWKVLDTKCALHGLERTAAWYLAVQALGLTFDEADKALGFEKTPWMPSRSGWVPFATAGKRGFAPLSIPFSPVLRRWELDKNEKLSGVTLTVRGCYYANHVENGRVVWWKDAYGFPFDVMCFLYRDFTANYSVYKLITTGEIASETETGAYRYPVLFAYSQDTGWVFLGRIDDKQMVHDLQQLNVNEDYAIMTAYWGEPPWTVERVETVWEIQPQPVPRDWQKVDDADKVRAIFAEAGPAVLTWIQQHAQYSVSPPKR